MPVRSASFVASFLLVLPAALGWGAHGHRVVTQLAMDRFDADAPEWLRGEELHERLAFQSNEPDRWKGTPTLALKHENNPDHFIDVEHLWLMDLTLESLPRLRRDYIAHTAISRHEDPAASPGTWNPDSDLAKAYQYPGFLPHAMLEHYEKLRSSFHTVRALEALAASGEEVGARLEQARENAIYHMGVLSHFVGDAAQPLHTTEHFNGWVGDNPSGYTTDSRFHEYVDSGVIDRHGVTRASSAGASSVEFHIDPHDPWPAILSYLGQSFRLVEPLYALEKTGALNEEAGRAFIEERLDAAGAMLAAMYQAAWDAAVPTAASTESFLKYADYRPVDEPEPALGSP